VALKKETQCQPTFRSQSARRMQKLKNILLLFAAIATVTSLSAKTLILPVEAIQESRHLSPQDFIDEFPGINATGFSLDDEGWYVRYKHENLTYFFGPIEDLEEAKKRKLEMDEVRQDIIRDRPSLASSTVGLIRFSLDNAIWGRRGSGDGGGMYGSQDGDGTSGGGIFVDQDGNGIPDALEDKNGNGIPDGLEEADLSDNDANGIPDALEDKNQNGIPDGLDDGNRNGILDGFESDGDGNGKVDALEDKNGNGIADGLEGTGNMSDQDGNGKPDALEDKNQNGVPDGQEGLYDSGQQGQGSQGEQQGSQGQQGSQSQQQGGSQSKSQQQGDSQSQSQQSSSSSQSGESGGSPGAGTPTQEESKKQQNQQPSQNIVELLKKIFGF
jgi:hypothetical protein